MIVMVFLGLKCNYLEVSDHVHLYNLSNLSHLYPFVHQFFPPFFWHFFIDFFWNIVLFSPPPFQPAHPCNRISNRGIFDPRAQTDTVCACVCPPPPQKVGRFPPPYPTIPWNLLKTLWNLLLSVGYYNFLKGFFMHFFIKRTCTFCYIGNLSQVSLLFQSIFPFNL